MGIVAIGAIAFFVFMASRFSQPQMALLYGGLDLNDSSQITSRLETMNTPFRLANNGTEILVPKDQVLRLRMNMAEDGLPAGGSIGYEIFDRSDALGTTNFVQNVNLVRALEGELSRTIRALNRVESARVHLVLPKRQVFAREKRQPSASIMLKLRGRRLDPGQVEAIRNLVAAAVPELETGRISIVDSHGNLLARGDGEGANTARAPAVLEEMRIAYEKRLESAVESLIERTVGRGKVRAEIAAEMDFDQITTNSEVYDPDGQVVRSTQTIEESANSSDGESENIVSVQNNLPEQQVDKTGGVNSKSASDRTEETVNYEITRTVKTETRQIGLVRRLSVAVLVDGIYTTDASGEAQYEPRSELELQSLAALVRSAIGFNEDRGDSVELVNLKFAQLETPFEDAEAEADYFGFSKDDLFRIAETLVLGLVAILVLLLIIRPMLNRILNAEPPAPAQIGHALATQLPGAGAAAIGAPGQIAGALPPGAEGGGNPESMIDLEHVDGRVKASSVNKISEIIEKHPEEAVAIMRQWIYEES